MSVSSTRTLVSIDTNYDFDSYRDEGDRNMRKWLQYRFHNNEDESGICADEYRQ
jgi:hypothetical protein